MPPHHRQPQKQQIPVISLAANPSGKPNDLANIVTAKLTTGMRTISVHGVLLKEW